MVIYAPRNVGSDKITVRPPLHVISCGEICISSTHAFLAVSRIVSSHPLGPGPGSRKGDYTPGDLEKNNNKKKQGGRIYLEENTKSFLGAVRKCQMPAASVLATYFEHEGAGLFKLYLVTMETIVVQTSLRPCLHGVGDPGLVG